MHLALYLTLLISGNLALVASLSLTRRNWRTDIEPFSIRSRTFHVALFPARYARPERLGTIRLLNALGLLLLTGALIVVGDDIVTSIHKSKEIPAVNLHGYQRFTRDVDLVIDLVPAQALKALQALNALGYKPNVPVNLTDFADPSIRESWIRDKGMVVFQMYSDQTRMSIDIFVRYPIDFEALWSQGIKVDLPGASLRIASIDHSIMMKREAAQSPVGSFEAAELFQLRMALKSTYAQRLQDLQEMLNFNSEAEARNPRLRWAAEQLRR